VIHNPSSNENQTELDINQKGRAEIIRRIDAEELKGARLRNLGWDQEEEHERLA
jgi:hypothetical protein